MKPVLQSPIYLPMKISRLLLGLIAVVSIVSCLIILNLPISFVSKLIGLILIVVSSIYYILRDALRLLPWSWHTLSINSGGVLQLINNRGQQFNIKIANISFVHAYLTIINGERQHALFDLPPIILLIDLRDEVRRLHVWLRWFKHQASISNNSDLTKNG